MPTESKTDRRKVTLVGAGPVGSLLSIYLARRGYEVEVYERRPDMRRRKVGAGRSINLAVSTRGLHALAEVALAEKILEQAIPMRGRMIHSPAGELAFQPYGRDESEYINSISRGGLNKILMTQAEATGRVRIHFNCRATGADFRAGTLELIDERDGRAWTVAADLIVGADGSASAVRQAMMALPGYHGQEEFLDYGYKELSIPPGPGGAFAMERNALHIWPRGTFMLIALPNFDGSYTCTLFLPLEGPVSFARLNTAGAVRQFFQEHFPDAVPLLDNLTGTFFENPTGHMSTVKCGPWHAGGRALLLGDAAHGIVPFFGQGMNAGFEDCTVLNECLDRQRSGGEPDWPRLFEEFYRLRKVNTDAIADMAVENFIEMRDKVGNPRFLLEKKVEKILEKQFPGRYYSRYHLVTFSRIPYRVAFDAGLILDQILAELCAGLPDAEAVDLHRAEQLICGKLTPFLQAHESELAAGLKASG